MPIFSSCSGSDHRPSRRCRLDCPSCQPSHQDIPQSLQEAIDSYETVGTFVNLQQNSLLIECRNKTGIKGGRGEDWRCVMSFSSFTGKQLCSGILSGTITGLKWLINWRLMSTGLSLLSPLISFPSYSICPVVEEQHSSLHSLLTVVSMLPFETAAAQEEKEQGKASGMLLSVF